MLTAASKHLRRYNDHTGTRRIKVTQYHDVIGGVTSKKWCVEIYFCVWSFASGNALQFLLFAAMRSFCAQQPHTAIFNHFPFP